MSGPLFDKTTAALNSAIQFRQLRQDVISTNIANAETPGFKAKKMDFEEALARAVDIDGKSKMMVDHNDHYMVGSGSVSRVTPDVYDNPEGQTNNDGNNVDLEREMAQLGENSIIYKTAIQLINKKLAALRYAATEGNR